MVGPFEDWYFPLTTPPSRPPQALRPRSPRPGDTYKTIFVKFNKSPTKSPEKRCFIGSFPSFLLEGESLWASLVACRSRD